jgi:hypothetical protein
MRLALLALVAACGHETSTCADDLALDIAQFTVDGYNAVIKDSGGGTINTTWTCPGGGSASITGTANTQTVTFDTDWTFHMCTDDVLGSTLTLDGVLHHTTTNGSMASTDLETGHSDALKLFGHNHICNADPIDNTCVVDYTIKGAGVDDTGSICGITFP